jgi:L-alanine-DL-glutamate epimerase-like enolase superfamily enzyme
MPKLHIAHESWPIAGAFTISRGSKTSAELVTVRLAQDGAVGRGECVPYARYGETVETTMAALEAARPAIEQGIARDELAGLVAPKAARNALDCALWDLEAKRTGVPAWRRAGLSVLRPLLTAYTLSLDTPAAMAAAAAKAAARPLLKLKLGGPGDAERLDAVRRAAPHARLIVDANEAWSAHDLAGMFAACAAARVELIEQPLPAGADEVLARHERPIPVCADESAHDREGLGRLLGKYDAINIKLDKTGGLTEALALADAARRHNLKIMVGCMLATSLAMAPAMLVGQLADIVDLDGPLLLARDREPGIRFEKSLMQPPPTALWG